MSKRSPSPPIPGIAHTTIQLPQQLHEMMKNLRLARREQEHGDIKLCRLYQEAVEYYLAAKPQRELLAEYIQQRTVAEAPDAAAQEALCADR